MAACLLHHQLPLLRAQTFTALTCDKCHQVTD